MKQYKKSSDKWMAIAGGDDNNFDRVRDDELQILALTMWFYLKMIEE